MTELNFGCNDCLPEGVLAAWGARLIFPDDVLPDRVSFIGDAEHKKDLVHYLRDVVKDRPFEIARVLAKTGRMKSGSSDTFILFEDNVCIVKASPQASFGYLYVAAWLKMHDPSTPQYTVAQNPGQFVFDDDPEPRDYADEPDSRNEWEV